MTEHGEAASILLDRLAEVRGMTRTELVERLILDAASMCGLWVEHNETGAMVPPFTHVPLTWDLTTLLTEQQARGFRKAVADAREKEHEETRERFRRVT